MNPVILFDLDGTLHDRTTGLRRFIDHQFVSRNLSAQGIDGDAWRARFIELDHKGKVWKDVVYDRLVAEFDLKDSIKSLLEEYVQHYADHAVIEQGAIECLAQLKSFGWKLGMVTNGRTEFQWKTIRSFGLDEWFDAIVISEACGFRKPDAEIFHSALSQLDGVAETSWHIGDDPTADFQGAKNAGLNALLYHPDEDESEEQIISLSNIVSRVTLSNRFEI